MKIIVMNDEGKFLVTTKEPNAPELTWTRSYSRALHFKDENEAKEALKTGGWDPKDFDHLKFKQA